jgi:GDP-L-fucose synthase
MTRVWISGASGMVGSAISKDLISRFQDWEIVGTSSKEVNLLDQVETKKFVSAFEPDIAILCAARVGGVQSNFMYPASFALENQTMQMNSLNALVQSRVKKIVFMGSACVYPKNAPLPLATVSLFGGQLEETNKWYAMAKLAMISALDAVNIQYGIEVCSVLPANLYGPNDNFHDQDGHVIPSLLMRAYKAKLEQRDELIVWGTGSPRREILFIEDLADAVGIVLNSQNVPKVLNIGSGEERSINEIATAVCRTVGFQGVINFDPSKPDGILRKPTDNSYMKSLGWSPRYNLDTGLTKTYQWLLSNINGVRTKGVMD